MDRRPRIAARAARRWAARARSTAISTIAASAGFRRLGAARQPRLELCRRAALLPRSERRMARPTTTYPRPRRQPADHRPRLARPDLRCLHRGRGAARHPAQPGLQRRHAGRRQLRAAHHPERPARERSARLPASGDEAAEPHRAHQRAATELVLEGKRAVGVRYNKGGPRSASKCAPPAK